MDIGQDKSLDFEYGRRMLKDVIRFTKEPKKFGSQRIKPQTCEFCASILCHWVAENSVVG